jgi:hypothetical protein
MHAWELGAAANLVIAVAYLGIALIVGRGLAASGAWRANPLAVATGLIFFSCGIGHGLHLLHLAVDEHGSRASQDWHLGVWDAGTAVIAVWYFTLRGRFPALVGGAALFEDMRERRRRATEIHDNVVQGIATAKLALELGDRERATIALESTLERAKAIITDLLGEPGTTLRRDERATIRPGG